MVYCGKPSRGCQMCRTRRIKCDETKPTCNQCLKSRRQCPGYKDDFDLIFRNETQATERRARRSINNKKTKLRVDEARARLEQSQGGSSSGTAGLRFVAAPPSSVLAPPGIPIEHQAVHYFLSSFVLLPKTNTSRGFLTYVIPLMKSEPPDTQLSTSFLAVAFGAFANRPNSKALRHMAAFHYERALKHVNAALKDPHVALSDQTLASVLLLGLFESICLRRANVGGWGTHIDGAVQLIKMRGRKQLRTPTGKALFLAVRSQMLINCLSGSKSAEFGIDYWTKGAILKDDMSNTVIKLNLQTSELRAEVNRFMALMPRTAETYEQVADLIRQAQDLERAFQDWEASLPVEWACMTAAWAEAIPDSDLGTSEVYPGRVDIYTDLFIACHWNLARAARLMLAGVVIRCTAWSCAPVHYTTAPGYAAASRLGMDMINEIIASIPYHLGWRGFGNEATSPHNTQDVSAFPCGNPSLETGKMLGAFFIVWPIFTVLCSDFTTDAQRKYILARMHYMSEVMGFNGAAVLTHFQLRLPSMIIKQDLYSLLLRSQKMTLGIYDSKPPSSAPVQPISSSPSTYSQSSAYNQFSPTTSLSQPQSTNFRQQPIPAITHHATSQLFGGEDEDEDTTLESEAQKETDWAKKAAEKVAFDRTFGSVIKETSGVNVEYLHSEPGQVMSPVEDEITEDLHVTAISTQNAGSNTVSPT